MFVLVSSRVTSITCDGWVAKPKHAQCSHFRSMAEVSFLPSANTRKRASASREDVVMARAKRIYILIIKVNKLFSFFSSRCFLKEIENMYFMFLSNFSINLLAFYHEWRSLIGYATHVLFCDR